MRTITLSAENASVLPSRPRASTHVPTQARTDGDDRPTVLHFAHSIGGGGAEAMLMNLVEACDVERFRTVVVTLNARPWPHLIRRLQDAGVTLHDLEATAFLRRDALVKLRAALHAERPDIVQTWMHHADFVGGWAARVAGVRKVVWGIHCREVYRNPDEGPGRSALFRRALALSSRFIPSRIVSCSAAAIEDHAKLGYPRAKMRWIPNGIDAERFKPDMDAALDTRAELSLPPNAPVVGYVGRFHEMKDLPTFLRAAAILQKRLPQAHFVLCGGVEVEMTMEERELLAQIPRRDQVRFESFRPDPWRLYPALNVFTLSSRTEACPMTVIEAMSCGVPCVTTEVGDCPRLLEGLGQVVPLRDPEALARAWEERLDLEVSAREEISRQSRQRVLDRFTIAQAARQYAETYSQLLEVRK